MPLIKRAFWNVTMLTSLLVNKVLVILEAPVTAEHNKSLVSLGKTETLSMLAGNY